jgi:plastocyanin
MKHRIALFTTAAAAVIALVIVGGALAARDSKDATNVQAVTVNMVDFKFRLSKSLLKPGKTTFTVYNRGKSIHDFDIVKVKSMPFIAPGKKFVFTVTLKAGTWRYVCTVPRHAALGMTGKIVAK